MNRNFAKISVAIVALVLVFAFCLTGCKINDVAADLDNTKNEVSANKTDAAKALEAAIKALEAKIAANDADCAAEIAALNAAVEAVKKAGEATDADLAAAEKTLNAAIDAVRASLDATKTELSDKITANDAKINTEVAALNAAIANAEAALKAAGAADKAALEESLAAAKAELEAALATLKADVEKLTVYVDEAVAALQAEIAAGNKDLTAAIVELKNALALASGEAADADAALKAELEQAIAEATKAIIDVVDIADAALQAQVDANAADIAAANAALEAAKVALEATHAEDKAALEAAIAELEETLSAEIEEVKNNLQAQITANAADIAAANAALEAAKAALEAAHAADKAALEAAIAELEEVLSARIDEVKAELEAQITANAADIAAANAALEAAKAALEAADAAAKAELEAKINALETAVYAKIDEVKAELEAKIDSLSGLVGELGESTTIIGKINEINSAIEGLNNTDADVAEKISGIEDEINALYAIIAEYQETTEEVVKAWHEIFATYKNWVECSAAYGVSAEDMLVVEAEYASAQIRLYRAFNADEVVAIKDAFFTVIENVKSGELDALNEIYNNLVEAEEILAANGDLVEVRAALDLARAGLDARTEAKLIINGKVVDLYEKYAAACVVYNNARIAALEAEYSAIVNKINEAKEYGDIDAIDALIAEFKAAVDAADAETEAGIPVADEVIATLNDYHVDLLMRTADKYLEISAELVNNATVETIDEVAATVKNALDKMEQERLTAMAALGIDVYGLSTKVVGTRTSIVSKYIDFAEAGVAAAEKLEDLVDDWAIIESVNVQIEALAALGIDVTAVAEERDALVSAYYAKYVDIYAANLTAEMNAYIDNLAAIFAEVNTTKIADIRADYFAFVDNRDFAEALRSNSEAVAALVAAEEKFVKVEEQFAALTALVEEAEGIAALLEDDVFTPVEGKNSEFLVINEYRTVAAAWVEAFDAFYAGFAAETNADAYNAIRAIINEVKFAEIEDAFEVAIYDLVDIARELINTIDAIKKDVEANGQHLDAIVDIEAAWAAFREWEQNATDADGVGFIISYISDGKYTNENLNTVLVNIQTAYDAYVELARIDWKECYIGTYQQALVEGTAVLTYKDDLSAVRAWFDEYGIVDFAFAAEHGLGGIGIAEIEAQLAEREAELEVLKAEREALVAALESERATLQETVNNIGAITTDSADELAALQAACIAWAEACVANEVELEVLDLAKLVAANEALAQLQEKVEYIKGLIAAFETPVIGVDPAAAKEAYIAAVNAIKAELAAFEEANDGYRACFTDAELAKVENANSELYASKCEAALEAFNAYEAAAQLVENETALAMMAVAYNNAVNAIADAEDVAALADIVALCSNKLDATVAVYNTYVAEIADIAEEYTAVLAKMATFLSNAATEIANVEDATLIDGIVDIYTAKLESTNAVYDAYVEASEGVEDNIILAKMDTYFNEAIKQIEKTTENVAYLQQIGTTAASKFENIKKNEDIEIEVPVCEHAYDHACDVDCNRCGEIREVADHVYDNACDTSCNICSWEREVEDHVYDNACDVDCNECGVVREVADHVYDNACDAFCNICEAEREVADHVYDHACDVDCNVCGDVRVPEDHVYDNNCDVDCNVCGDVREVGDHVYEDACDVDCDECGEVDNTRGHVYSGVCDPDCEVCGDIRTTGGHAFENACDTVCNECGAVREFNGHVYNNNCDVDCNECGDVREVADHVYNNNCDVDCNECGDVREVADHVYDNACDVDCNECGDVREVADHVYDNVCDVDCNECGEVDNTRGHVYDNACDVDCNECGDIREVGDHKYENACDEYCDECGMPREIEHVDADFDGLCDVCGFVKGSTAEWPLDLQLGWTTTPEFVAGTSLANPGIQAYFYTYTVEADGLLIVDAGETVSVIVNGEYVEGPVAVVAGDVVEIVVEAEWDMETWTLITDGIFFVVEVAAPGSQNNPFELTFGWTTTPEFVAGTSMMDPGVQSYFYTGVANADGLLIVDAGETVSVIVNGSFVDGSAQVVAGDVIEVVAEAAWDMETWTMLTDGVFFALQIAAPGTQNNPFELELGWTTTPEFVAGTSMMDPGIQTYFYTYTVEADGLLIVDAGETVSVIVNGQYVEGPVAVVVGDVVEIVVEAEWDMETWTLITDGIFFVVEIAAPGTANNPFELVIGENTTPEFIAGTSMMDPGVQEYYYTWVVTEVGTISISNLENISLIINGEFVDGYSAQVAVGDVVEIVVYATWDMETWEMLTTPITFSVICNCEHEYAMNEVGAFACVYCKDVLSAPTTVAIGEGLYNRVVLSDTLSSAYVNGYLTYNEAGHITISGNDTNADPGMDHVVAVPFGPSFDGEGAPVSQRYVVMRYRTDTANAQFRFVAWGTEPDFSDTFMTVKNMGTDGVWATAIIDLGRTADVGERIDIRCNIDANTTDISHIATFATAEEAQTYLNLLKESLMCEEHPEYVIHSNGAVLCTVCSSVIYIPTTYTAGSDIYYRATTLQTSIAGITFTQTPCVDNGDYVTITGIGDPANALAATNFFSVAQGGAYEGFTPVIQRYLVMRVRTNAAFNLMYVVTYNGTAAQPWSNPVDLAGASQGEWVAIVVDLFGDASAGSRVDISLNLGSEVGTQTDISHMASFTTLEEAEAYANILQPGKCKHTTVETGWEGSEAGQVRCTSCGVVSTPVTYQAGADLYAAVDPTSQDYALVTNTGAGVAVNGLGTHAYGPGVNLKLTSGVEFGKYMVVVYKIDTASSFLGTSVDDNINNYVTLSPAAPGAWAVCNYGETNVSGNVLELICNYAGSSNSTSIYGVVTFETAEEAEVFAQYLTPILGMLP